LLRFEGVTATILSDYVKGNDSDNIINALDGNDYLEGEAGSDTIVGWKW